MAHNNKKQHDRNYYLKHKEPIKLRTKAYYENNKEVSLLKMKDRYQKNRQKKLEYAKEYRKTHKEKIALYLKNWGKQNHDWINNYNREKYCTDIHYRLKIALRTRLTKALQGDAIKGSFVRDLGCTISELKFYLEGKFKDGMSWDNYGINGWEIDHDIPLSFFDLSTREQFLKACHYTNLRPMWSTDNRRKGNKIISELSAMGLS